MRLADNLHVKEQAGQFPSDMAFCTYASPRSSWQRSMLTITEEMQRMFLIIVVKTFQEACRKIRLTSRAKARMPVAEWDSMCNYTCVMLAVKNEAMKAGVDEAVLASLNLAMLARCGMYVLHGGFVVMFLDESDTERVGARGVAFSPLPGIT